MFLIYAKEFVLKKPESGSATDKIINIMEGKGYSHSFKKRDKINPNMMERVLSFSPLKWYTPKELTVLFNGLRGQVELAIDHDKVAIGKNKDVSVKEKPAELKLLLKGRIKDLKDLESLIPHMVGDFRKRRDEALKGFTAAEIEDLKKRRDLDWVEHPDKFVKEWQDAVYSAEEAAAHKETGDPMLQKRVVKKPDEKEKSTGTATFSKFKDLENDMMSLIKDIDGWATDLGNDKKSHISDPADIEKQMEKQGSGGGTNEESAESKYQNLTTEERAKATEKKYLEKVKIYEEYIKSLDLSASDQKKVDMDLGSMKKEIPSFVHSDKNVILYANLISYSLDVYKRQNSMYNSVIWVRQVKEETPLEDVHKKNIPVTETAKTADVGTLTELYKHILSERKAVVDQIHHFTGVDLYAPESRMKADQVLKKVNKFTSDCETYFDKYEQENKKVRTEKKTEVKPVQAEVMGDKASIPEFDKAFKFEETIGRIEKIKDKQAVEWAKEELGDIYDYFKKVYLNPPKKVLDITKELKKSPQDLIEEGMKDVNNIFVAFWEKFAEERASGDEEVESKPSKMPEKYSNLNKIVEHLQKEGVFPEVSLAKPPKKKEPPKKVIINYVEQHWMDEASNFAVELKGRTHSVWDAFESGGGGGVIRDVPKNRDNPVVNGVGEQMKQMMIDFLEDEKETPRAFINNIFHHIGSGLKQQHSHGEGTDIGTLMSDILNIMRKIPMIVRGIRVRSSLLTPKYRPVGKSAVEDAFRDIVKKVADKPPVKVDKINKRPGAADIFIYSLDEAEALRKKVDNLQELIDKIIAPEKLGTLELAGFSAVYDELKREKSELKKGFEEVLDFPSQLSLNVCVASLGQDSLEDIEAILS